MSKDISESTLTYLIRHYEILSAQNGAEPEQDWTLRALVELRNIRKATSPKLPEQMNNELPGKNDSYIDKCEGWNACLAEIKRLNRVE